MKLTTISGLIALSMTAACTLSEGSGGAGGDGNDTTSTSSAPSSTSSSKSTSSGVTQASTTSGNPSSGTGAIGERAWCNALPVDTWTPIPGSAFLPWAQAGGIPGPESDYRGTAPFTSMVDAFCDPAIDPDGNVYFYGGGHGDGTCNAVVHLDISDFSYRLVAPPTPPSAYLPSYLVETTVSYPSGKPFGGWFLPADQLSDPADAPYAAPALARVSTHMYGAAAKRNATIHYFYLTYAELDTTTGTWSGQDVNLGQQLTAFRPEYGDVPLQQGTVATYDEVTDRFFVTLNPGDAGGGWRNGFIQFNPTTRQIEAVYEIAEELGGPMGNSFNVVRVGRDLYVFSKLGNYLEPQIMHQGFVFNMDDHGYRKFVVDGAAGDDTFTSVIRQETIPSFYDGVAIRRWNYEAGKENTILSVSPTPVSGTGTAADPLVLSQSTRQLGGTIGNVSFVYTRFFWDRHSGCALVIPSANQDWHALRLSP